MKKLLLILLCLPFIGFGQGWEQTYGGGDNETGYSVEQTADGGYIICGSAGSGDISLGGYDIYLLKTDGNGQEQWSQTFGAINSSERAYSVKQSSDGGYIVVGSTDWANPSFIFILKTDGNGQEQWSQTFGDSLSSHRAFSIQKTTDGGYIISGSSSAGSFLLKTDGNGQEQWLEYYNGLGFSSQQTSDGGYILFTTGDGTTSGNGIIKTDANGVQQWSQQLSFGGGDVMDFSSIEHTSDGGYIIMTDVEGVGSGAVGEGLATCIHKVDANGMEQWVQCYDTTNALGALGWGNGQQTVDGGYIMTGLSILYNSLYDDYPEIDIYLLKTDMNGVEQWRKTFGDIGMPEYGYAVQQTADGGYIISGTYNDNSMMEFNNDDSDVYLIKTDANGNATFTLNIPINPNRKLQKTVDILGKETKPQTNTPLIDIYDDGTVEKRIVIE